MKKLITMVLALGMLFSMFTACGAEEAPSTVTGAAETAEATELNNSAADGNELEGKLVLWSQWNETETQGQVFQEYAEDFMKLHDKVEIEIQWCGRDISKTLKTALDGGETIDIYDYPLEYGNELASRTLDLTELVKKAYQSTNGKPLNEVISSSLLATARMQTQSPDQQLAVGYTPYLQMFLYNETMFEQAGIEKNPTTWEELDAVCAKLKEAGFAPISMDDAYATMLPGMFLEREKGEDFIEELINDSTGEMWRDEAVVKMAKAFEDFAKKGYFHENVGGNKWPAGQTDVANGKAALYYTGTWLPNEVRDITGPDFKWGAFTYPDTVAGAGKSAMSESGGSSMLAVSKSCKNPELAMEFISFIYTPENDQKFVELTASIPSGADTPWPAALEGLKPAFNSVTKIIKSSGGIVDNPDVKPVLSENFIQLCAGKISADQFVENMATSMAGK